LRFRYTDCGRKIGLLDPLVGKSGWLKVTKLTIKSFEEEDQLFAAVLTDEGHPLHPDIGSALFQLKADLLGSYEPNPETICSLEGRSNNIQDQRLATNMERNRKYFDEEIDKLDRWADDLKHGLEVELKDVEATIKRLRNEARSAIELSSKLSIHRQIKDSENLRSHKRRDLYEAQDQIDASKEELISKVERRLDQHLESIALFCIRWSIV
jgi:hypothetical protein